MTDIYYIVASNVLYTIGRVQVVSVLVRICLNYDT